MSTPTPLKPRTRKTDTADFLKSKAALIKEETVRLNFHVPVSIHKQFKSKVALEDGLTMSDILLKCVKEYMCK